MEHQSECKNCGQNGFQWGKAYCQYCGYTEGPEQDQFLRNLLEKNIDDLNATVGEGRFRHKFYSVSCSVIILFLSNIVVALRESAPYLAVSREETLVEFLRGAASTIIDNTGILLLIIPLEIMWFAVIYFQIYHYLRARKAKKFWMG